MAIHVNDGKYLFFSDDDGPNLKVSAYGEQAILWLFYKFIPFYFMFILIMLII